ncbi:hypothetical protein CSKR_201715 [Clonorchis sinensis]|uniref:Uncharacterized protein n=1 Tax=Clonorchis sinensis TaxID=79923 RepID=A0A8T1MUT5_CLOSI|nr:hypothetical protein CSKR_201715 [Clonorchis sinensis]
MPEELQRLADELFTTVAHAGLGINQKEPFVLRQVESQARVGASRLERILLVTGKFYITPKIFVC